MRKKIVFYFRKGIIAQGDFSLYNRIAAYISEKYDDINVYSINNFNSEIQKQYDKSKIILTKITDDNSSQFDDAIFITAFNLLFYLLNDIKNIKNARILLVFAHPQIVNWFLNQVNIKKFNIKSFYTLLCNKSAYCFMDTSNMIAAKQFYDINFENKFFPALLYNTEQQKFYEKNIISKNQINIGWFGRLDKDKIYSVINFLDNVYESQLNLPINFHIIGDGNSKNLINIQKYSPKIRFFFTSYLYGSDKDDYLKNHLDVVLAMGISALDCAVLGIPTIVPIVSPDSFRDDKFVYLNDIKGYSLAWNKNEIKNLKLNYHTAESVLNDIYTLDKKNEIGKKCFAFALENFAVERRAEEIIDIFLSTQLTVKDCLNSKSIARQLREFKCYKFIRKNRDYSDFILFRAKVNRIRNDSIVNKVKFLNANMKKIIRKGLSK